MGKYKWMRSWIIVGRHMLVDALPNVNNDKMTPLVRDSPTARQQSIRILRIAYDEACLKGSSSALSRPPVCGKVSFQLWTFVPRRTHHSSSALGRTSVIDGEVSAVQFLPIPTNFLSRL